MNEILIYEPIERGIAERVIDQLSRMHGPVTVRINSEGGYVSEAIAIYNALKRHGGRVTTFIDSVALSAGAYIAMSGDDRYMSENASLMMHSSRCETAGNAAELEDQTRAMRMFDESMATAFCAASGKSKEEVMELISRDTWLNATQALEMGFITAITEPSMAMACAKTMWDIAVKRNLAKGMTIMAAASAVEQSHPGLRAQMVAQANPEKAQPEPKKEPEQTESVVASTSDGTVATDRWKNLVRDKIRSGKDGNSAAAEVDRDWPGLREKMLQEVNKR